MLNTSDIENPYYRYDKYNQFIITGESRRVKMGTSRFELTDDEIGVIIFQSSNSGLDKFDTARKIRQAQVSKVLSSIEPVELEALRDEEMKIVIKDNIALLSDVNKVVELLFNISLATVQHNQAKGRLYRLKEE